MLFACESLDWTPRPATNAPVLPTFAAQRMDVTAIAKVAFRSSDRVRDVINNFSADGFEGGHGGFRARVPEPQVDHRCHPRRQDNIVSLDPPFVGGGSSGPRMGAFLTSSSLSALVLRRRDIGEETKCLHTSF
jgi:hypothetical protein